MGTSNISHGKKFDKETQSPLLKIFKDMMTREKDDPEKRNLLLEPKEDNKKRRQYSGSRSKTDRRSCESSSSEHRKRSGQYKPSSTEQRAEFKQGRPPSLTYQSEKKDSFWFWQKDQNQTEKRQTEDTCSCVSCALKRIVSSEYACIGCLLFLFTISIIVAFLVVFKSVPALASSDPIDKELPEHPMVDSDRLKRKIEMLNENRKKNEMLELEEFRKIEKRGGYDDILSAHIGLPGESGIDFGPSFRELSSLDETDSKMSADTDWSSVLDTAKDNDFQSSEKLREFYKKLVQTDAKIKNLKKIDEGYLETDETLLKSPERSKRSLKLYSYPKRYRVMRRRKSAQFSKNHRPSNGSLLRRHSNKTRLKRKHDSEVPSGFVIEKKKLIIQYKPVNDRRMEFERIKDKKCSHAPKESHEHTHENQLKHPFYKNSQRLDELLDKFLNKNLPEILSDPFGLDSLFTREKAVKCKHPANPSKNFNILKDQQYLIDQIPKPKSKNKIMKEEKKFEEQTELMKLLRPETSTNYEKDFFHHESQMVGKEKQKIVTASPNDFEVLLSVSTIMNPDIKKTGKLPLADYRERGPNLRRLMQLEGEDDENLGYEDFKEVLTDNVEDIDDTDKRVDRKKRKDEQPVPSEKFPKLNPPGVHNPNWKGPMPLYPDELSSMIRHAALNANKIEIPTTTSKNKITLNFLERKGRDISDIEYVEDYLNNKYVKLVEMAQAYSDYGVLDGKKEMARNEKNSGSDVTATDHRVKLSPDRVIKAGLLSRLKEDRPPDSVTATTETIRLERTITIGDIEDMTEQNGGIPNTFFYTPPHTAEGIRFEMRPTAKAKSRDDDLELFKMLQKHIKIGPAISTVQRKGTPTKQKQTSGIHTTMISTYPDIELVYGPKKKGKAGKATTASKKAKKPEEQFEQDNGLVFSISKGKRILLSTDYHTTEDTDWEGDFESGGLAFEQFIKQFKLKNQSRESAINHYIERIKQKNIRIYSSVHPDLRNFEPTKRPEGHLSTMTSFTGVFKQNAPQPTLNQTIVTINNSHINLDEDAADIYHGQMFLTVENEDIGTQHIDLRFKVPLVIDFNEDLYLLNDTINFTGNNYNQSEPATGFSKARYYHNRSDKNPASYATAKIKAIFVKRTEKKRAKRIVTLTNTTLVTNSSTVNETTTAKITKSDVNITNIVFETESNTIVDESEPIIVNGSYHTNWTESKPNQVKHSSESESMSLSDFFTMISDWFKALEGVKIEKPKDTTDDDLTKVLQKLSNSSELKKATESVYPLYDSDMIENIGHRSRVLLSIDSLTNQTDEKGTETSNVTRVRREETIGGNVSEVTIVTASVTDPVKNITTTEKNIKTKTKPPKKAKTKVKAIFKRNADDSNLIFWNDIYDDEYGIQNDKFDTSVRDKHSIKQNDFIQRSGRWVHNKIKQFAENLKMNPHDREMAIKERVPRAIKSHGIATYPKYLYHKITDRVSRHDLDDKEEDDYDSEQKSIFTALSANMKDVCKKAARAVQQTRNIEVREDSKSGSIAASLMQQLVRLLTDLVDYQVQQKTCTKLPADLQHFLEWLTIPKEESQETQADAFIYKTPYQEDDLIEELELQSDKPNDQPTDYENQATSDKTGTGDLRVHYLETLHAVQDLLQHYDDMSDDDKSKMTGVKSYLEGQMRYLNKQLAGYDVFNLFDKNQHGLRYKRELPTNKRRPAKRRKRKQNKYVKNFGKKHTRTTASFDDAVPITDVKRIVVKKDKTLDTVNTAYNDKVSKDVRRNLKDVYYKAIAEAKKYATGKNIHKKDDVTGFGSSTAVDHK